MTAIPAKTDLTGTGVTTGQFKANLNLLIDYLTGLLGEGGDGIEGAVFADATDTTKQVALALAGIATGTQRTLTMPDADVDLGQLTGIGIGSKDTTAAAAAVSGTTLSAAMLAAGALVEWGSNANGSYWRWESGFQVCTHSLAAAGNATTAVGSVFNTGSRSWTFPAQFSSVPRVSVGVEGGLSSCWGAMGTNSASASSASFILFRAESFAVTPTASLIAIGEWK